MSAHTEVELRTRRNAVLTAIHYAVLDHFGIGHTTIQLEEPEHAERDRHA